MAEILHPNSPNHSCVINKTGRVPRRTLRPSINENKGLLVFSRKNSMSIQRKKVPLDVMRQLQSRKLAEPLSIEMLC